MQVGPDAIISKTQDVTFFSAPDVWLAGRIYLPDENNDRHAGVVVCHGFGGVKEGTPVGISDLLAQHGYTVLTFDYRGFGGSEGARNHLVPSEQVEDAVSGVEYLAQEAGLNLQKVAIYGHSFGGGIAVIAAKRSERLQAAFVTVPVTSGDRWLRSVNRYYEYRQTKARAREAMAKRTASGQMEMVDRFDLVPPDPFSRARHTEKQAFTLETFYHVSHHEPLAVADKIDIPFGIIGIRSDLLVPVEQSLWLYEKLVGPKQIHLFDTGTHHSVYDELLGQVAERAISWFDRYLGEEEQQR